MKERPMPSESGMDISEYETRKKYIDDSLRRVGWVEGKDWTNEVEVEGMPNRTGLGYVDYVLWGDDGRPLAVVEAKRYSKDPGVGRHQAWLYAELLEKRFGRRPIIFLSNGKNVRIWDDRHYQEREVFGVYSKEDLEKLLSLEKNRSPVLHDAIVDDNITNRYYQKAAIKAVGSAFESKRRKALLVMATGSGKTRTAVSLVQVLMTKGWVKNILFLADRTILVDQATAAFNNNLPNLSVTNICRESPDTKSRCIVSTYQTMINLIDKVTDENGGLLYTPGHFDLVITDEAHRSIYNLYGAIFDYFDSLLVGLTATPKDEVDKNTYELFDLQRGEPTYAYEYAQAIKDGYLVDFYSIETKLKFLEEGIVYADLDEEERKEYEDKFLDSEDGLPDIKESRELNEWIFNRDTIVKVLNILMTKGHRVDGGNRIGKTIIFAKNHMHAEQIKAVFDVEYPMLLGQCQVIDNTVKYADKLIDEHFKVADDNPLIAVSVDMLDTGVDVPEIQNLVFFKKVYSKTKFWQMIGRGTRLCKGLEDGKDKKDFYIFDFCSNFEFFGMHPKGLQVDAGFTIQSRIFDLKLRLIWSLNNITIVTDETEVFRQELVEDVIRKIKELNRESFTVTKHLGCIDEFSDPERFRTLTEEDLKRIEDEIVPLIQPYEGNILSISFDSLMYQMELAKLTGDDKSWTYREARKRVASLLNVNIKAVTDHKDTIVEFLKDGFLEECGFLDVESLRKELRDLMVYMPEGKKKIEFTNFRDTIQQMETKHSDIPDMGLQRYREKAEAYVRTHKDEDVIKKLYTNEPLDKDDIEKLQRILWSDLGTKDDYSSEFGNKGLGVFVREILGLDMNAAKKAFSEFINETTMTDEQYYFVNQVIEYVVQNGVILDTEVLTESPFTDRGNLGKIFGSNMDAWYRIMNVIDSINDNARTT